MRKVLKSSLGLGWVRSLFTRRLRQVHARQWLMADRWGSFAILTVMLACGDGTLSAQVGVTPHGSPDSEFAARNRTGLDKEDAANCDGIAGCSNGIDDGLSAVVGASVPCDQSETQTFVMFEDEDYSSFVLSVAVSGDTAIIGEVTRTCNYANGCESEGKFHGLVFDGSEWVRRQLSFGPGAAYNNTFGFRVAIDGDTAVVGNTFEDCAAGHLCGSVRVYRFDYPRWVFQQKLTASDAADGDRFGAAVAISGTTLMVTATWDECENGASLCGAVYVFQFDGTNWVQTQKLVASERRGGSRYGRSIAVDGNLAIVGVRTDYCTDLYLCGSAYTYAFDGSEWVETQRLTASGEPERAQFGTSVSLSGTTAIVGAPNALCADGSGRECGAVYVFGFDGDSWIEKQKIQLNSIPGHRFGTSVALSEEIALVGRSVLRLEGSLWIERKKLDVTDVAWRRGLGNTVSFDGHTALLTSKDNFCGFDDLSCGAVNFFDIGNADCNCNDIDDAGEIANCDGDPACGDCDGNGVPDGCQENIDLDRDGDADGDGLFDGCDACSYSQTSESIMIGACNTGVANVLFEDGCTMGDVIAECYSDRNKKRVITANAKRQSDSDFVVCVTETAQAWERDREISSRGVAKIVSCAERSESTSARDMRELQKRGAVTNP
jgi:FG-GAP repeat